MNWFIKVPQINGRIDWYSIVKLLEFMGNVEYHPGEKTNSGLIIYPHLKFDDEHDALAFSLKSGSTISTHVPTNNS